jgi:hypothetical protein
MRALILTEEWKSMGTPVWSHHGIVCTGETYTKVVPASALMLSGGGRGVVHAGCLGPQPPHVGSLDPRRGSVKVGGLLAHLLAPHWRSF